MVGGDSKKILIIDDDNRNTFALKAVLNAKSFNCNTAKSAEEGLELLSENSEFGVVLLDMMMPEMDSCEAIQAIRLQHQKNIPVIYPTAQAMQGDEGKCLEAGATAYISKPVDIEKLLSLLNRHL